MKRTKEDVFFILLFSSAVCFIFWDLATLKSAFLKGDYLQQFFPWFKFYSDSIKELHLPLWTRYVQCGFPIFAEGQLGALYPFNLFFFLALPFKFAYNWSFLFHFILSGVFTYFYARKMGADLLGGFLSAGLVCFGSSYAGLFYVMPALKCLTWFPAVLLIYEFYLEKREERYVLLIGLLAAMQFLAGTFQMAFYASVFYVVYFLYRDRQEGIAFSRFIRNSLIIFVIIVLINLPQLGPTLQLAAYSNRPFGTADFAFWNSLSPLSLMGIFMPYLGALFSKSNLIYIGIVGFFFAIAGMFFIKEKKELRVLALIFVLSLFFALGKYNPLYVILVKLFHFYSFRGPSKFIYFSVFSLSVLSGIGFSYFTGMETKKLSFLCRIFMAISMVFLGLLFIFKLIFSYFGDTILKTAKIYVTGNIYGTPFHRHSLTSYMERTEAFFNAVKEHISFGNPYVALSIALVLGATLVVYIIMKTEKKNFVLRYACIGFISLELFVFSGFSRGVWGELADFSYPEPGQKKIFNIVRSDRTLFRILPFGNFKGMPLWLLPSANLLYGLDSAAFYSPLANRDYFLLTQDLGIVDDSLGIVLPEAGNLYKKLGLLRRLNVKYIVSTIELNDLSLDLVTSEKGVRLYELNNFFQRFTFSSDLLGESSDNAGINVEEYTSGYARLSIDRKGDGFLLFSEKNYPGWKAYIDGKETEIQKYHEVLQAVKVPAGGHTVVFQYRLDYLKILLALQIFTIFVVLIVICYRNKKIFWGQV